MGSFTSLENLLLSTAEAVRPPDRMTVPEAAEKYRFLNNPGSYVGPWRNDLNPPLVKPMEALTSLEHRAMVFVGPAQSGKTEMALSWVNYSVTCDPVDMMIVDKRQKDARDFYQRRLSKLYRTTAAVRKRLMPGTKGETTFSSQFTNGMLLTLSWPTPTEFSGKPIGRLWMADYDRYDENIGGEGGAFDLARNRAKSFKSLGMVVAESSPSRPVTTQKWKAKTPHEAPPTTGILELYNRGDRHMWYWPCASCDVPFEPCFSKMRWNEDIADKLERAHDAWMECPHCQHRYREVAQEDGTPGKSQMNQRGFWMADGQTFDQETGEICGRPRRSDIASFWLKGPAAQFAEWPDMVAKYFDALEAFERTGDENPLMTTVNTEQALPFMSKRIEAQRLPEELMDRAADIGERGTVPAGVRFLIGSVDVQPNRFECGVHGFGENGDMYVVDRFKIRKSKRLDEDGHPFALNTYSYVEDWQVLIEQMAERTYAIEGSEGLRMSIKITGVDSGGKAGTTKTAADFWRSLRDDPEGRNLHLRIMLLKGEPRNTAPLVRIDYPDAARKDRNSGLRGDVPLVFIQSNKGKDMADAMLGREEEGHGFVHFPDWLPDWYYSELTAETRMPKGWENAGKAQNESWDLLYYAIGFAYSPKVKLQGIDWSKPPIWATEGEGNPLIVSDGQRPFEYHGKRDIDLKALAAKLA
jgi:phage terminase large subunit GpA-like protein